MNVSEWTESIHVERTPEAFSPRVGRRFIVGQGWDARARSGFQRSLAYFTHEGIEPAYASYRVGFRCAKSFTNQ